MQPPPELIRVTSLSVYRLLLLPPSDNTSKTVLPRLSCLTSGVWPCILHQTWMSTQRDELIDALFDLSRVSVKPHTGLRAIAELDKEELSPGMLTS